MSSPDWAERYDVACAVESDERGVREGWNEDSPHSLIPENHIPFSTHL